jgi:hypothetical protein
LNENLKLKSVLNVPFSTFCLFWHGIAPFWLLFLERKFEIEKLSKVHNVVIFLPSPAWNLTKFCKRIDMCAASKNPKICNMVVVVFF